MFWPSFWVCYIILDSDKGASLVSLGLLFGARPRIYFYPFSDVSLAIVVGLSSRTIIIIVSRVCVCP